MAGENGLEIDLPKLVGALYRRKYLLLGLGLLGAGIGFAHFKLAKPRYSSKVIFTSESGQGKGRLDQFAFLTGGFELGSDASPFLTHIEKYASSREVSDQLRWMRFGDSTLWDLLVKGEVVRGDSSFTFHSAITKRFKLKKDADGLFNLEAETSNPALSRFLADSLFAALERNISEKKRQNTNRRLEFVNALVDKYQEEMRAASDRTRAFQEANFGATSPALLQKRAFLAMDQKLAEEKFLTSAKQREELRVQMEQRQEQLVVIEPAYVPLFQSYPTKSKSILPSFLLFLLLGIVAFAYVDRKKWIYPV